MQEYSLISIPSMPCQPPRHQQIVLIHLPGGILCWLNEVLRFPLKPWLRVLVLAAGIIIAALTLLGPLLPGSQWVGLSRSWW